MNHVSSARPAPPAWALAVAFGVIYVAWGTTYYAVKLGVRDEHMPPLLFGGSRIILAGLLLLGYQWLRGASLRLPVADAARLIVIGWVMFVAGNGLITYGQKTVDSSVAAIMIATTPLWIGLVATFWPDDERLTARGWLGLAVGLAGVGVLMLPDLSQAEGASPWQLDGVGSACVIGSAASWAVGSVSLRHGRIRLEHLTAAGYQMLFGGVSMLTVGALLGEPAQLPSEVTPGATAVFLYLLVVGSLGGFVAFNWLLGHVSAAKVGTYAYVNPVIAVLIGWCFGEELSWTIAAGMAVILFGVYLVRGGERKRGGKS